MSINKPIYVGSVKSLYDSGENEVTFNFSDRYSVFDWGEMPDHITNKGKALSELAIFFFEYLSDANNWQNWSYNYPLTESQKQWLSRFCEKGIHHHYLGIGREIPNSLRVKKVVVPDVEVSKGEYDYRYYQDKPTSCLIPLEVIFRHGVPAGSSLVKRDKNVSFGDKFSRPYIEFSTKLEKKDRYINHEEAKTMAALSDTEFRNLIDMTTLYSLRLKDMFAAYDIELWDGKFEFAYDESRNIMLVDSIGPDELRLVKDNISLSKEFLREFYSESQWKRELTLAQKEFPKNWKEKMEESGNTPSSLDHSYKDVFADFYQSLVNLVTGKQVFDVDDFSSVLERMKNVREMRCK